MESIMKVVSIMLVLLIAVQAQESFTSDFSSDFSESEFPQDSQFNTDLPFQSKQFSFETNSPLETEFSNPQLSEETNSPFGTQSSPSDITNSDSDLSSIDPDVDDSNLPLVTPGSPTEIGTVSREPPPPPPTEIGTVSREPPPPPYSPPGHGIVPKENICKGHCLIKCKRKETRVLRKLCINNCKRIDHLYECTDQCGEAMPNNFKSDVKKALGYLNYCYNKCVKKVL